MEEQFSVQSLISSHLRKKTRGEEKREIKSWYASGLGGCLTSRYLQRTQETIPTEYDDRTLRVFASGKHFEDWLVEILKAEIGDKSCQTQVRCEDEELNLTGYADFLVTTPLGNKIVYECKTKHSRAFFYMKNKGEGPMVQHKMQLWSYLYCLKINEGRLIYIEKDSLSLLEYPIFLADAKLEAIVRDELNELNACLRERHVPAPVMDKKDWRYKYCRLHEQCLEAYKQQEEKNNTLKI